MEHLRPVMHDGERSKERYRRNVRVENRHREQNLSLVVLTFIGAKGQQSRHGGSKKRISKPYLLLETAMAD